MSRLPEELELLGSQLEAATARAVRRRTRRHSLFSGAGAVLVAVPLAVAISAADLAPDDRALRLSVPTPFAPGATAGPTPTPLTRSGSPAPSSPATCPDAAVCGAPAFISHPFVPAGRT